jgi:hypothetical protein
MGGTLDVLGDLDGEPDARTEYAIRAVERIAVTQGTKVV